MTSQKQSQMTNEILQGNLIKLMFKLVIPGMLGMLVSGLNSFINAFFAGQYISTTAVAAISIAAPLTFIIGGFAEIIGVGSASLLSRAIGSGDIKNQSKIFGNLIVVIIIMASFITIIGYSFGEQLIMFMGARGELASAGADYFKTYILGSLFFMLAISCSQIIKSEGQVKFAMISAGIFAASDIILNYIFTAILHWGIRGLALSTVFAMVIYSILNLTYFFSGKSSFPVNYKKFALAIDLLPSILSIGLSLILVPVTSLVQDFVIFKSISIYGTDQDIAFFGATERLSSLAFLPLSGFIIGLQPVIGINYGARNYKRLKKAYLIFISGAISTLTLLWLPLQLLPKIFLNLLLPDVNFTQNDLFNFQILNLLIPIMPFIGFTGNLFLYTGKEKIVAAVLLFKSLLIFVPLVFLFSRLLGVNGIYYGIIATNILFVLIVILLTVKEFKSLEKMEVEKMTG